MDRSDDHLRQSMQHGAPITASIHLDPWFLACGQQGESQMSNEFARDSKLLGLDLLSGSESFLKDLNPEDESSISGGNRRRSRRSRMSRMSRPTRRSRRSRRRAFD